MAPITKPWRFGVATLHKGPEKLWFGLVRESLPTITAGLGIFSSIIAYPVPA